MLSNAFSRSMKLMYSGVFHSLLCSKIWRRVKMWSEQDRPGRKPACCGRRSFSRTAVSLDNTILLKTLLVRERGVMPLQLLQSPRSPFLGNLKMRPVFHASGIWPSSQICLKISVRMGAVTFTSAFNISAVTPSAPGALPLFIALIAAVTSSRLSGSVQISRSVSAGWMSARWGGSGLFRTDSKCSFQRCSFSASFSITIPFLFFTGTSQFLNPLFSCLLILYSERL